MIIHQTPGLLDIRSITTMGLSAKPTTDNPIGMFGTGLKYAIATLVRLGAEPQLWIGKDCYIFTTKQQTFRDQPYSAIIMRTQKEGWAKPRPVPLPFTAEYGKFWKPWMAFRELHSNTLDEQGATTQQPTSPVTGHAGHTLFVVDHPDYDEAYANRDDIFLPKGMRERPEPSTWLEVRPEPSNRIYYRSLRAMDTKQQCVVTWNVLTDIELTEDRTIKYEFTVKGHIARHILTSNDYHLIEKVVTAPKGTFEHELEFPNWIEPSETFRKVMMANPKGRSHAVTHYFASHDRSPPRAAGAAEEVWSRHPGPWLVNGREVVDAAGAVIFDCPVGYKGRWSEFAEEIVKRLAKNPAPTRAEEPADVL